MLQQHLDMNPFSILCTAPHPEFLQTKHHYVQKQFLLLQLRVLLKFMAKQNEKKQKEYIYLISYKDQISTKNIVHNTA